MRIRSFRYLPWPDRGEDEVAYALESVATATEEALPAHLTVLYEGFLPSEDDVHLAEDPDFDEGDCCVGFVYAIIEAEGDETISDATKAAREEVRSRLREARRKAARQGKLF